MSETLKPCPFCGSQNHPYHKENCFIINAHYSTDEAYNIRPIEDALRAELAAVTAQRDALRAALVRIRDSEAILVRFCAARLKAVK